MARNIAAQHGRVYRAVTKVRRHIQGVLQDEVHTDIEGAYNTPGPAKARVSFWRGYLEDDFVDGWVEESDPITWHRLGEESPKPPAPVANARGFLDYSGPIETDYGHQIQVYESSSARGPHTWLSLEDKNPANLSYEEIAALPHAGISMGPSTQVDGHTAHLSLAQAIRLRAALDQFIEGVPERWTEGRYMLAEAYKEAFPPVAEAETPTKG